METFGKIIATILLVILSTILSGLVLSSLWGWFIVPITHLSPISVAQAIGLSTVTQFLLLGVTMNMKSDVDTNKSFTTIIIGKFITGLCTYGLFYLMGYIIQQYL